MDLRSTGHTLNTIDLEWDCAEDDGYAVTYQMLRPDNAPSNHPEFAEQSVAVAGSANSVALTGLNGPFEYAVEVCSNTVNSTCGCSSGKFRTFGVAVYVNSIQHYNETGALGGQSLEGAFFFDTSAACVSVAELTFGTCDVTVTVYQAESDPAVKQYPGTGSNQVQIAVSSAYRGNFVTFKAEFESTTDACWNGVLNLGNNPALDNVAVNETIDANTDYMGAPANSQSEIYADTVNIDTRTTSTTSIIDLTVMVFADVFDEFNNNVTDDLGVDTGIAMQNQTNFLIQGNFNNATTDLNEGLVACDWSVSISLDIDCANVQDLEGNLSYTDDGSAGFDATGAPGLTEFVMTGKIPAPDVLAGCSVDDLKGTSATVELRSFDP